MNQSLTDGEFGISELKRMCARYPIRPLISKWNGKVSFEACSGTMLDPKTGKYKKLRKTFGSENWGSVKEALDQAKLWIADMKHTSNAEKSAVISIPMDVRPQLLYIADTCRDRGLDLVKVFQKGLEAIEAEKVSTEITFSEAGDRTISYKQREGKAEIYIRDLKMIYKSFGNDFGSTKLHEITPEDVEDWLEDREIGPVTWNNYRRQLGVLWSFAESRRNGWVKENIISHVAQKNVKAEAVTALTIAQAKVVLATAQQELPRLVPYLCVGMFAGLRRSEAQVACWEDIDWETKTIRARGGKMRTASDRFVDLEPVFIDWMKPIAQSEGPLCTGEYARRDDIKKLRELTFDFDSNIFRHTYGSYHHAAFKRSQHTAAEMGHASVQMLLRVYRRPIPREIAVKFWALDRASVLGPVESEVRA